MGYMILEVKVIEDGNIEEARKWAGALIRDGDGLYMEEGRLFLVLASRDFSDPVAAIQRLNQQGFPLGLEVVARPMGSDAIADSLYRRAESHILPVDPRQS